MKPIIFSTPMVQSILEGRKTQTRRICKDNGDSLIGYEYVIDNPTYPEYWKGKKSEPYTGWVAKFNNLKIAMPRSCPYGKVGDALWVRESFCPGFSDEKQIHYKADDPNLKEFKRMGWKWKPSIHMPKEAARIFLKIADIKVERVQDISEEDILKEGLEKNMPVMLKAFGELWDKINGERASWESNPFVWVISFNKIDKPI